MTHNRIRQSNHFSEKKRLLSFDKTQALLPHRNCVQTFGQTEKLHHGWFENAA